MAWSALTCISGVAVCTNTSISIVLPHPTPPYMYRPGRCGPGCKGAAPEADAVLLPPGLLLPAEVPKKPVTPDQNPPPLLLPDECLCEPLCGRPACLCGAPCVPPVCVDAGPDW